MEMDPVRQANLTAYVRYWALVDVSVISFWMIFFWGISECESGEISAGMGSGGLRAQNGKRHWLQCSLWKEATHWGDLETNSKPFLLNPWIIIKYYDFIVPLVMLGQVSGMEFS